VPSPKETQSAKELLAGDHAALDKLLKTLLVALDEDEASTILQRLDLFWARLAMHIRAENLHLFPALLNQLEEPAPQANQSSPAAETHQAIAQLRADHDFFMHELAAAIKAVRSLKDTGHSEAGNQSMKNLRAHIMVLSKRLESHNEVEEELVYSLPVQVLTLSEEQALVKGIQRELRNLPPRFSNGQAEPHEI